MKENKTNLIAQLAGWFTLVVAVLLVGHDARAQLVYDNSANVVTNGSGQAAVVTQNAGYEFGDEIVLDPAVNNAAMVVTGVSTNVILNDFKFEYYLSEADYSKITAITSISNWVHTVAGKSVTTKITLTNGYTTNFTYPKWTVDLKFYAMDGAQYGSNYNAPGTLLYDSKVQTLSGIAAVGRNTLDFNVANKMIPATGVLLPLDFTWTVTFGGAALESSNSVGLVEYTSPVVGSDYPDYWEKSGVAGAWVDKVDGTNAVDFGATGSATTTTDSKLPTCKIDSTPKDKAVFVNSPTFAVTGTAAVTSKIPNDKIALVQWRLNSGSWTPATGTTVWSANVTLPTDFASGNGTTNLFEVQSIDLVNGTSTIASKHFIFVSQQPCLIDVVGTGTATLNKVAYATTGNSVPLQVGNSYTVSVAQPGDNSYYYSNIVYSYTDNSGAAQSGIGDHSQAVSLKYTFTMSTNMHLTFNFVANKFIAAAGNYNGLFIDPSGADTATAGYFTLTVNADKTRSYSGAIFMNGVKNAFAKGGFALDGTAAATTANGGYTVNLKLPLGGDNASVTGAVINAGMNSPLDGVKATPSLGIAYAGTYTMVLPGVSHGTPEGDATATLAIDGTTKATATLGNINFGPEVGKQQVPVVSKDGDIPVYVALNAAGDAPDSLAIGWLKVNPANPAASKLTGHLTWVNVAPTSLDSLKEGITRDADIISSPYAVPASGSPIVTFAAGDSYNVTNSDPSIGTVSQVTNAAIHLGQQGQAISVPIVSTAAGILPLTGYTVKVTPIYNKAKPPVITGYTDKYTAVAAPYTLKITTKMNDGHITGSVVDPSDSYILSPTFNGVVLQAQGQVRGGFTANGSYGYLLMQ